MSKQVLSRQSSDDSAIIVKKHRQRSSNSVQSESSYIIELEKKISILCETLDITESKLDKANAKLNFTKSELETSKQLYNTLFINYKKTVNNIYIHKKIILSIIFFISMLLLL